MGAIAMSLILGTVSVVVADQGLLDFWTDDKMARENRVIEAAQITSDNLSVYFSPNKKAFVYLEILDSSTMTEYLPVRPVLSRNGQDLKLNFKFDYLPGSNNPSIVWLNDNEILLAGKMIYNIKDNTFRDITLFADLNFLASYAVDPQRTRVGIQGRFKGKEELEVGYIDLKTLQYHQVHSYMPQENWPEITPQLGWDNNGALYFDAPEGNRPEIKKFDGNKVVSFALDAMYPQLSPQGTRLAFIKTNSLSIGRNSLPEETVLYDVSSNKELIKLGKFGHAVWGEDDSLSGLTDGVTIRLYQTKTGSVFDKELPKDSGVELSLKPNGIEANVVETMPDGTKKLRKTVIPLGR